MMNVLAAYTVYQLKRYLRAPITLGWTFVLPVMFLLIFGGAQMRFLGVYATPPESLGDRAVHAYAGFLAMGLLGLNVASTGIFGFGVVLVQARHLGIMRRLALTPQPAWKFIGGQVLASGTIVALSTLLLLAVAALAFDVPLPRRIAEWCLVLGLGSTTFLTIGYALAASMQEVRTAQLVGNTTFLVLMFLGGVWIPLEALPAHVQWISRALPLSHLLEALRAVGCHGRPVAEQLLSLAVLVVWGVSAAGVAMVQFRGNAAL